MLSERRGSNPRPRPWQGRALPTELLSRSILKWNAKLMNEFYYSRKNCFFFKILILAYYLGEYSEKLSRRDFDLVPTI
jgi:hypothetical protein